MQAAFASRCLRMMSPSISSRSLNHTSQVALNPTRVALQSNLSPVFTGARSLSSQPRLWNSSRTTLKINAFLSDFPSRPPQNPVSTLVFTYLWYELSMFQYYFIEWIDVLFPILTGNYRQTGYPAKWVCVVFNSCKSSIKARANGVVEENWSFWRTSRRH